MQKTGAVGAVLIICVSIPKIAEIKLRSKQIFPQI